MPSFPIAFRRERSPRRRALSSALARSANSAGKRTFGGSLTRLRASSTPSATAKRFVRGRARRGRMTRADDELGRLAVLVLGLLLAGLVLVEPIAAKAQTQREIRRRRAVPSPSRRLKRDFDLLRAGHLAENESSEHDEIERGVVLARRDPDNDKPEASRPAGARMSSAVRWAPRKFEALAAARIRGSRSPNCAVTAAAGFMSAPTNTTSALPLVADKEPNAILTAPLMSGWFQVWMEATSPDAGGASYRGVCSARQ